MTLAKFEALIEKYTCKDIVVVDSPIGRLGLSVCYDLRFPEIYQLLRFQHGAQVLLVPAAFTAVTGEAHWEILLRAHAIENQCYVIAVAQAGKHNDKRESYSDTLIIDPWGTVVSRLPGLKTCMRNGYSYLEGIEQMLLALKKSNFEMHACTNYPIWYQLIEDKLKISFKQQ